MSEERSWEEFGLWLDSNFHRQTKYFGKPFAVCVGKVCTTASIKDSNGNILRNEKEILSRWREYFEDLLNPVRATPTDTCDTIDFRKEEVFTSTEVATAIRGLKFEKVSGKDKLRLEMLKALNGEGVRWLTRVCQVAWNFGKMLKYWQISVIIPICKNGDHKECTNYRGISLPSLPGKVYAKCL